MKAAPCRFLNWTSRCRRSRPMRERWYTSWSSFAGRAWPYSTEAGSGSTLWRSVAAAARAVDECVTGFRTSIDDTLAHARADHEPSLAQHREVTAHRAERKAQHHGQFAAGGRPSQLAEDRGPPPADQPFQRRVARRVLGGGSTGGIDQ